MTMRDLDFLEEPCDEDGEREAGEEAGEAEAVAVLLAARKERKNNIAPAAATVVIKMMTHTHI